MRDDERVTIIGLQGSGKTVQANELVYEIHARTTRKVLVVDIMDEYKFPPNVATVFRIKNKSQPTAELETLIKTLIIEPWKNKVAKSKRYAALLIDETPQFWPHGKPLPPHAALLNHTMRHMDCGLVCMGRRIVQMNVDIAELSHRLIIYRQTGKNDLKRLEDMKEGLGDAVRDLQKYHYVELDEDRNFRTRPPVKLRQESL